MRKKQIGEVPIGGKFVTLATRREGEVLPAEPRDDCAVYVHLNGPSEDKYIHPEIRVQVAD